MPVVPGCHQLPRNHQHLCNALCSQGLPTPIITAMLPQSYAPLNEQIVTVTITVTMSPPRLQGCWARCGSSCQCGR